MLHKSFYRARSDRKRISKSSLNNSFLFLHPQPSSTTPASRSLICSAIWTRQRRWREAPSIRIMAPTTAITIKRRLWRARLIAFRWERKELSLFADADWCRYFNDFPSEYFLRRDTSKHICFNFPETFFFHSLTIVLCSETWATNATSQRRRLQARPAHQALSKVLLRTGNFVLIQQNSKFNFFPSQQLGLKQQPIVSGERLLQHESLRLARSARAGLAVIRESQLGWVDGEF